MITNNENQLVVAYLNHLFNAFTTTKNVNPCFHLELISVFLDFQKSEISAYYYKGPHT